MAVMKTVTFLIVARVIGDKDCNSAPDGDGELTRAIMIMMVCHSSDRCDTTCELVFKWCFKLESTSLMYSIDQLVGRI